MTHKTECDNRTVFVNNFEVGEKGCIIYKTGEVEWVEINWVAKRSTDTRLYDNTDCWESLAPRGLLWDFSCEFVEDNDRYYVFLKEVRTDKDNWKSYIEYLQIWADDHRDFADYGSSPNTFVEYLNDIDEE